LEYVALASSRISSVVFPVYDPVGRSVAMSTPV
jgi:hypothetical protein